MIILSLLSLGFTAAGAQWTQTTPLPDAYAYHSLVYASGFLYNAGGGSDTYGVIDGTNVFYAQVQSSGMIGAWNHGTPLPEAVFAHAGVASGGFLYVLSGYHYTPANGIVLTNIVYCARINSDGSVGYWNTVTPLPHAVFFGSAAVWNNTIYVIGGSNGDTNYNTVYSATIRADGSLSGWIAQPPLPDAEVFQAEAANGSMLYVLGGVHNGGTQNTVYYSKINTDGTLAGWQQSTPLPQPLDEFAAIAAAGRVFTIGGWNGSGQQVSAFYIAPVAGDGSLGSWSSGTSLPHPLYLHAAAVTDSYIFVSGGADTAMNYREVYSMALPPPPAPPPAPPILTSQGFGTNGSFQLQLASDTNTGFGILASTNLTDWLRIGASFTDTNGLLFFEDTNAANFPRRYYRAFWPLP